ncbi:MAG: pentapeptide repeat-containing protein, partial [Cyanobacteria bacterium J06641_2]
EELIAKGANGLRQLVTVNSQRLVIVVDQFEEVFTLCKSNEERSKFFDCLLGGLQQCGNQVCLVLTMRSDFFGKCTEQEYSGLAQQIQNNLVTVTPMTRDELKQAIVEPAKQVELNIEPELVEEMLVDVANAPGSLPLLQDTLTELWKKRSNNCLQVKTYSQLGGVMGTLRQRANKVYESFDKDEQAVCKQVFLALTQLGEGTEDTRRRVFKQDLVNKRYPEELIDSVVQQLADEKLVVTSEIVEKGDESKRVVVVDVAHEALIRYWDLLRGWIDENREKVIKRRVTISMINELRKHGSKVNLARANLSGIDLSDANLRGADLGDANLSDANLSYANLRGADLGDANLSDANLSYANLSYADLIGAHLSDANLSYADLRGADLRGADLSAANLSGAKLEGAKFAYANLSNANLSGAKLSGAKLSGAKLSGANLSGANISGANLMRADFNGADLSDADLSFANLNGVIFWDKKFSWKEAKNITTAQIKRAKNWEKAIYSPKFRKELGLPPHEE